MFTIRLSRRTAGRILAGVLVVDAAVGVALLALLAWRFW